MTTPNLGMTKPVVGADTDTWGDELNADLDLIDARCAKVAFSAYLNSATQSIPDSTNTKVTLNAEEFDIGGYFDSTTNSRFQPGVAGYYSFSGRVDFANFTATGAFILPFLYKNGSIAKRGSGMTNVSGTNGWHPTVDALIHLNGSTDYVELFVFQSNGGAVNARGGDATQTYLTGALLFPG